MTTGKTAPENAVPAQSRRARRAAQAAQPSAAVQEPLLGDDQLEDDRSLTAGKGRATPSRRQREDEAQEEGNFLQRTGRNLRGYFEGVQSEIGKVAWPSAADLQRLTIVVTITLIISSIVLGSIALFFTELFRLGLETPILLMGFMAISVAVGYFVNRWYSRRSALSRY
jgi:preprotein translocase SecE subunit